MTIAQAALPLVTADIPGTGGSVREHPEDFRVEEIPVYEPAGHGDHVLATVEKRDRSTPDLVQAMARALGIRARDVGTAGMKDRHAVTRQRVSFPPPVSPEAVAALELPGVRVLAAERHPHKLRTGHLAGNRFVLRLRQTEVPANEAAARARAALESLARAPGCPNWYGAQRFGAAGDNAERGRELVTGARSPGAAPPRRRRLLVSAYQSLLFNEHLRRRIEDGLFRAAIEGDILRPVRSRSVFFCDAPHEDQMRIERGEIVATGPMFGHRMTCPPEGTEASRRETALLADEGIDLDAFRRVGKLATGTRRALAVPVGDPAVEAGSDGSVELRFDLPAGAYATAALREVVKPAEGFPA